ncbi:MAG: hypothetical protein COY09_01010 [Candidatus Portnoybacteria bacterium CG_4_10_14_0_2_um_filter_39_11]|uniref:DUF3048 domain-containing protein n=1 Tax=Candidatus Portnoybacteria bacterium CG_4_10_14_0_2_um_filter_39_11 TaxID=1974797 RepID=A0A2M7UJB9_9BACT|nr:MAG: hypothetical protein COY09_01010 [Candidatus Portnoybacteria bacterium CG_4_10_14_0_2_um_filter_39_11]
MDILRKYKKHLLMIAVALIVLLVVGLSWSILKQPQRFEVRAGDSAVNNSLNAGDNKFDQSKVSPLSGVPCQNYQRRPVAVMISSDEVARPLSGLTSADLVVEMPVLLGGITRMMAVFACDLPEEIGSIRSARHDFIPLAQGWDAIYAHWGGSHFALDQLSKKVIDDLDALTNPYSVFYRKNTIAKPHNGFTSGERLLKTIDSIGFRQTANLSGYLHQPTTENNDHLDGVGVLSIGYPGISKVEFKYDPTINKYWRWRDKAKELDRNNLEQVAAAAIVVVRAQSRYLEDQYNDVALDGQGQCEVYQNGKRQDCLWQKDRGDAKSQIRFTNSVGQDIKFVPGQMWIEIIEPDREVSWTTE